MKQRKRFNRNRICSSENYELSQAVHRSALRQNHEEFVKSDLYKRASKIHVTPKAVAIRFFGKPLRISYKDYLERASDFKVLEVFY